ncbi:MAG: IPT/TIG domain-containing protein [Planctomycetes bacterium]|nr:IPT/TIG domain-containing protein [Planctomycetota bacterium]
MDRRQNAQGVRWLVLAAAMVSAAPLVCAQGWVVNGGFETLDSTGWTEWVSPWALGSTYDYAWPEDPYDGESSLYLSSPNASFGVYQEMCVESGVPVEIDWAWKGATATGGNGWWEVLIVDAPYSYEAVDDPAGHPETFLAAKWEVGFGGPYPEPSAVWEDGVAELTPFSDVITIVLKCGSTEGGLVEAWFDAVAVSHDTSILEVTSVEPAMGRLEGGETIRVLGRVFPDGTTVALGDGALEQSVRLNTCAVEGITPAGTAGLVDVVVTTPGGSATLPSAFRYVPPPEVTSITPSSAGTEGGVEVTIAGADFVGGGAGNITAQIGGSLLTSLVVVDESTITGIAPAGEAGPADVTVTTPFGTGTLAGGFTYEEEVPETRFVRGDANSSSQIDLTDGIAILGYLYLGQQAPACMDAADADDSGDLSITDAIRIFGWLFLGGAAPSPPAPSDAGYALEDCGVDPPSDPPDALDCAAPSATCAP